MVQTAILAAAAAAALLSTAAAQQFVMYTPGGDDTAVQRMDPIMSPGAIGQHVHQFFGSSAINANSTYAEMQTSSCTTVADAENNGNADDNSAYWVPALYMQALNGSGYIRVPTNGHKLYYKNAGSTKDTLADPFEFPEGFRMLAGDAYQRAYAQDVQSQNITQWICHASDSTNQGTYGGFPTGVTNCDATDGFNGALHFPHCWNGDAFNISAPDAHMSYPVGDVEEGECPASHPTRLPHIFMENTFNLNAVYDVVVPDSFVLAQGDSTGYGWHADFFNGWVSGAIPELLATCPQGEYGNEDIGDCPTFNKTSVAASDCSLITYYSENVDSPGQYLPGCNPISDVNPAPIRETVGLGISTDTCAIVADGSLLSDFYSSGVSAAAAATSAVVESSASTPASTTAATATASSSSSSSSSVAVASSSTGVDKTSSSVAAVAAAATSSVAQTSSSNGTLSCPEDNGVQYSSDNGKVFEVTCGIDHVAGNLAMLYVDSLADCVAACSAQAECVSVSLSGTACYMKKTLGAAVDDSGIYGATLVNSSSSSTTASDVVTSASVIAASTLADYDMVYMTTIITVTATPTPAAIQARHEHAQNHMLKHARGRRAY